MSPPSGPAARCSDDVEMPISDLDPASWIAGPQRIAERTSWATETGQQVTEDEVDPWRPTKLPLGPNNWPAALTWTGSLHRKGLHPETLWKRAVDRRSLGSQTREPRGSKGAHIQLSGKHPARTFNYPPLCPLTSKSLPAIFNCHHRAATIRSARTEPLGPRSRARTQPVLMAVWKAWHSKRAFYKSRNRGHLPHPGRPFSLSETQQSYPPALAVPTQGLLHSRRLLPPPCGTILLLQRRQHFFNTSRDAYNGPGSLCRPTSLAKHSVKPSLNLSWGQPTGATLTSFCDHSARIPEPSGPLVPQAGFSARRDTRQFAESLKISRENTGSAHPF